MDEKPKHRLTLLKAGLQSCVGAPKPPKPRGNSGLKTGENSENHQVTQKPLSTPHRVSVVKKQMDRAQSQRPHLPTDYNCQVPLPAQVTKPGPKQEAGVLGTLKMTSRPCPGPVSSNAKKPKGPKYKEVKGLPNTLCSSCVDRPSRAGVKQIFMDPTQKLHFTESLNDNNNKSKPSIPELRRQRQSDL